MDLPSVISMVAAFISLISAVIGTRNLRLAEKKFEMDAFKWQRDYFADMSKWADTCLDILSDATHLCDVDPSRGTDFHKTRLGLMSKVSALIDRGRFFFPNYDADHGKDKLPPFQGYRHEVLDTLVSTYRLLGQVSFSQHAPNRALRDLFVEQKRLFTAHVQQVLDPRARQGEYVKILSSVSGAREAR